MKRATKMMLFIAVTAVTFGSLNYFTGRRHCGGDFGPWQRDGRPMPWQHNSTPVNTPVQNM